MAKDIRRVLKAAKSVRFSDSEYFRKDITGVRNLEDVKDWFNIRGRLRRVAEFSNVITYRLDDSGYEFQLIIEY